METPAVRQLSATLQPNQHHPSPLEDFVVSVRKFTGWIVLGSVIVALVTDILR